MDFDPYSDQGHGNHKLDHWAQLWSTSQGRIPLKMSTVHRSNEGKCYGSIAYFFYLWRVNNLNQVWMRHSQRDLVMHTTPSNLDASFSLILFVSCRTPLFIDKENGDNPNSEKNSLQFNKGSIWPSKERNWDSSMPRKEESRLSRMAFLNWRGWLTFWSISSSPTSERVSPVAISASGSGRSRNYSTSSKGVKEWN